MLDEILGSEIRLPTTLGRAKLHNRKASSSAPPGIESAVHALRGEFEHACTREQMWIAVDEIREWHAEIVAEQRRDAMSVSVPRMHADALALSEILRGGRLTRADVERRCGWGPKRLRRARERLEEAGKMLPPYRDGSRDYFYELRAA